MLVSTKKLLLKANKGKYAVPAFNMNNLEILQGIVAGAEKMKSPVIIQTSEGAIEYAGMENLASLFYNAAKKTKIPMALHFDHGKNLKTVLLALKSGWYQSVMYDGSSLPYKENVANTKKVVKMAHARGVSVEAELGAIPGKEDNVDVHQREASYTNPHQALDFVNRTGCDFLAISIGTAHGANKFVGKSRLDFKRLELIAALVKRPLVLHGASGVPETLVTRYKKYSKVLHDENRLANAKGVSAAHISRAVALGIDKVNIDTDLRIAFMVALREKLITDDTEIDQRKILAPARDLIAQVVESKIRLLGSKNRK